MRLLRTKFLSKFLAVFMLITIVESTLHATVSLALTTGPHQPEYTSYEEPGATDMVNLLTGDFTFNLPILEVPGPEGGFSVPLTYNAGIGLDQEASWVGLGWNINVGAITRSVVQYPDDASGEVQSTTRKDLDGVRGWNSNVLGFGQAGWNTQQGHYGTISLLGILSYSYSKDGNSVGVAGINVGSNGVSFDAVQFAMAVFTIATMGAGSVAEFAVQTAISIGTGAVLSYVAGNQTPNAPTDGYWEYSKRTSSGFLGIWKDYWMWLDQTRYEEMLGVLNFDKARVDLTQIGGSSYYFASLSLLVNGQDQGRGRSISTYNKNGNSQGVASDVSYNISGSYKDSNSPVVIASDNYSVKAPGISGDITPYRLEVGSVSTPRSMSQNHTRLAVLLHQRYKVPFIYEGSNANSYFYHVGSATTENVSSPTFHYGISADPSSSDANANNSISLNLNDLTFNGFYGQIKPEVRSTKKIPMATHVEWLSNDEIESNSLSGMMDYFSGSERTQFRQAFTFGPKKHLYSSSSDLTNGRIDLRKEDLVYFTVGQTLKMDVTAFDLDYDWAVDQGNKVTYPIVTTVTEVSPANSTGPYYIIANPSSFNGLAGKYCELNIEVNGSKRPNSIGGYAITGVNGMTYHFALPSYEYENETRIEDKTSPNTKYSIIKRDEPFASTWLLTGITGPDFVDRNANGSIDVGDWGHWVKFNYGKHLDKYQWRIPYSGTVRDAANESNSSSTGHKQIYYLNSIETRSHVALFVKDSRLDNRGLNGTSSLRLSEIDLLTREDYQKLFLPTAQGGYGLATDTGLDNIFEMWMVSDFFSASGAQPPQGNFIIQNALKRIKFTHTYDLCPNTDNSIASNKGKLTLTRVAIMGRNDSKTVPDYKFEYGSNPSYNINQWDGWGMYSSSGSSSYDSHKASSNDADGAAWSLRRITNPMGSIIDVSFERDTYSTISGEVLYDQTVSFGGFSTDYYSQSSSYNGVNSSLSTILLSNPSQFKVGDVVNISGTAQYTCSGSNTPNYASYSGDFTVQTVGIDRINVANNFRNITNCPSGLVTFNSESGTIRRLTKAKSGGNIRVAALTLNDNDKQYKTRYVYNDERGFSTGVVAREPDYIKTQDYSFYDLPGYPFTSVLYSKVTVLTGKLSNDSDYHTKQVYEFETPHKSMVTNSGVSDANFKHVATKYGFSYTKSIKNQISDFTSKIGKLKSVETFDKLRGAVSSSSMIYTSSSISNRNPSTNAIENNNQGVYSQGTLIFDLLYENQNAYHKIARTTVLKYPTELVKVTNTKDGFTTETENKIWDLTTGLVVEKTEKSALGLYTKKVTKLAHTVPAYAEMGSKAVSISNKNMLGHEAANYTYLMDANGNSIGLLGASVQTWKSDWANYRYFNGTSYTEGSDGSPNVWRKHQTYTYKGMYADLRADGSLNFTDSKKFSFVTDAANAGWLKTSEATRYDHYSALMEGKDLNNIFSSSKKDIAGKWVYANATNATYHEFAYSGAEDWDEAGTGAYLGGEVSKGAGTKVTKTPAGTETHSGQFASQVGSGGKTFTYKPASLTNNRLYRVSAWTNSLAGAIYYILNPLSGGTEQTVLPVSTNKVGNWYQINAEIPVGTFTSLEVGVKSTSGTISFDDFRFQPLDAAVTANVYDPITGNVTFSLDNQNMFTKYEYNDRGQLTKTYSESFKYGVTLVSESKTGYKRFNTNQ